MNLCRKHDCAYDANSCPACDLDDEVSEKDKEIVRLEKEISDLESNE